MKHRAFVAILTIFALLTLLAPERVALALPAMGPRNGSGWATFTDTVYGYAIQHPDSWYVYPASGAAGSVTTLSNYDLQATTVPTDTLRIEIALAIYDRDLNVSLQDWVRLPSGFSDRISVMTDRPLFITDELVMQSYNTPEGAVRTAFVARGSKVYILTLIPDTPAQDALFAQIAQGLTFVDSVERQQEVTSRLYPDDSPFSIFLPLISQSTGNPTTPKPNRPQVVPSNYRLPFVGSWKITRVYPTWREITW